MNAGKGKRGHVIKRSSNNKNKKIITIILVSAIVIIASLIGYSLSIKGIVKEWNQKIYSGVTVQDIDLGGMTKEQAKQELKEKLQGTIGNKKLYIEVEDKKFELIYSDISPIYDIDTAVDDAYNFGKNHGIFAKYFAIKNKSSKKNSIDVSLTYDEEKLKEYETSLKNEVTKAPQNATIVTNGSEISVSKEVAGKSIDIDTLDGKIKETIKNGKISEDTKLVLELEEIQPKVISSDLAKVNGVLGTFSSDYSSSPLGRSTNIEIATKAINGCVLMPGETFSFNEIVGPRTVERGYREAATYVANKVEPGIGGGICQVSTALYRTLMHANIRSVERRNHSMAVGYAKPGLDATVSYGDIDYKFKNTYDFPIYIQASTHNKIMTYTVYGDKNALNGKKYDMVNEVTETIPPQVKLVNDPSLPEGKEVPEGGGTTGYKANSYQITYENGVEVSRELIATDYYASVDSIVKKGTAVVAPVTPAPAVPGTETVPTPEAPTTPGATPGVTPALEPAAATPEPAVQTAPPIS